MNLPNIHDYVSLTSSLSNSEFNKHHNCFSLFNKSKIPKINHMKKAKNYFINSSRNNGLLYNPLLKNQSVITNTLIPIDESLKDFQKYYNFTDRSINESTKTVEDGSKYITKTEPLVTQEDSRNIKSTMRKSFIKDHNLQININQEEYSNPRNSLIRLKFNKALVKKVGNLLNISQSESYREKVLKITHEKNILRKMPNAKITNLAPKESEIQELMENKIKKSGSDLEIINKEDHFIRAKLIKECSYYFTRFLPQQKMVPSSRCQATFTHLKDTPNNFLLLGGFSICPLFDFWIYNAKINNWSLIKPRGGDFLPRYGHSTVYYNGNIFIFGGKVSNTRQLPSEDFIIFNPMYNTLKKGFFKRGRAKIIKRRNHIAEIFGSTMIVHGGYNLIDEEAGPISAFQLLDLDNFTWSDLHYERRFKISVNKHPLTTNKSSSSEINLAYHSSCVVLSKTNFLKDKLNIYNIEGNQMDIEKQKKLKNRIKYEGVYIFGGIDEYGQYSDSLFVLEIGIDPCILHRPKINGKGPCKRSNCQMCFYSDYNFVIIYGGKNVSNTLNDMFILDVINFNWVSINLLGVTNLPRAEGVCAIYSNKLIIFGGNNETKFIASKVFEVDLDFKKNNKMKNKYDYATRVLLDDENDPNALKFLSLLEQGLDIPDTLYPFIE